MLCASTLHADDTTIKFTGAESQCVQRSFSSSSTGLIWDEKTWDWEIGGGGWLGGATFESSDSVTFSFNPPQEGVSTLIDIIGDVDPSSITVSGTGNFNFGGSGKITGSATLLKEGTGSLVFNNGGNDFTGAITVAGGELAITASNELSGGVTVNSDASLSIYADKALGSGTATIKSGGSIRFYGLDHYSSTTVTREEGSTLEFIYNRQSNTDADLKLGTGSLSGGRTLAASGGGTISIGGVINATSTTDRYLREDEGYTVNIAANTTLQDNVRLALGGGTTTIKGSGVYEVHSVELSAADAGATTLNIEEGATLKVSSTEQSSDGDSGAFMLSHYNANNTVNVRGTLDLASGISSAKGEGTLAVADTGTLIMRQGLITHTGGGTKNVDINGGTLVLHTQADTLNHAVNGLVVDIANGSTILGASATTTVNTALALSNATGDVYTFGSAPDTNGTPANTISLRQTMTAGNATVKVSSGTLELGGADNTIGTADLSAGVTLKTDTTADASMTITNATLGEGAAIRTNNMSIGNLAIAGKNGADASIVAQAGGGSGVSAANNSSIDIEHHGFLKVDVSNATITGSPDARPVETVLTRNSSFKNVSFSNVMLDTGFTKTTLTDVTLNNVTYNSTGSGRFTLAGDMHILNMILNATSFRFIAPGTTFTYTNAVLTAYGTSKTSDLSITHEAAEATDVQAWTISGLSALLANASGTLTFDIREELTDFSEFGTGDGEQPFAAFIIAGITSLGDLDPENIRFRFSANGKSYIQEAIGYTMSGGNLVLYIPEPSTATLSLLALAALAARRRRKSA